ncbi:hypothetical protein K8I85_01465 [bacterium]|nr:hypothetical protein [bacterium]
MRTLRRIALLLGTLPCLLAAGSALADRPATGRDAVALLEADFAAGRIDRETYLVERFRNAFAPERAAARYRADDRSPVRCFTPVIARFHADRDQLSAAALAELRGYLDPPRASQLSTYVSPDGGFEFTYETTGPHAVDPTDVDPANGIPDWVEKCATYADTTWNKLITDIGLPAPVLPADGTYDISFEALGAGYYGYTEIQGATTRVVIHNTFTGFGWPGPNDDPEGNELGRAKATIAHEFQHAIQYSISAWTEGYWIELDAMWAEDTVFDQTNDFHNWIANGSLSQLDEPETRLDNGGEGSYEDCLWEYYLAEDFGTQIIVDLWDIRAAAPAQGMKDSYGDALAMHGSTWGAAWPTLYEWCWFTGGRAEPPFGFSDAPDFYKMELLEPTVFTLPYDSGPQDVDRLAGEPRKFKFTAATGSPRILFDGEDAHPDFTLSVLAVEPDGSFTIARPALDANSDADYTVPMPWSVLDYVGVIVTNSDRDGGPQPYRLRVLDPSAATAVAPGDVAAAEHVALLPNRPNPFRGETTIRYSIPAPTAGRVRVYDVAGRAVRTLVSGDLPAGPAAVTWDGADDTGNPVPAGVYWSRVETRHASVARKLILVR